LLALFWSVFDSSAASAHPAWYRVEIGAGEEAGVTALDGNGTGMVLISMFLMAQEPGLCLVLPQQPASPTWVRYQPAQFQVIFSPLSSLSLLHRKYCCYLRQPEGFKCLVQ